MTLTDRQIRNIATRNGVDGSKLVALVRAWESDGALMSKTSVSNLAREMGIGKETDPTEKPL